MKRIFTLLLALVMVLSLAAPALAAEDVFEAFEAGEAAPEAPIAPEAPVEEEAPAPEAPDIPQAAAVEPEDAAPEDTETAPDDAQTGKLTVLGDVDQLWYVLVDNEAGEEIAYIGDYEDIPLRVGDTVYLTLDYRYTAQLDAGEILLDIRGTLGSATPEGLHAGDLDHAIVVYIPTEGSCDLTVTVVEDPDAPTLIPVTWEAPEGVYVETKDTIVPGGYGLFTCDKGYVPLFTGAESYLRFNAGNDRILTMFEVHKDAESVHVDVRKATGELHITDPEEKVVYAGVFDSLLADGDAGNGLVGGLILSIVVEAGYDVKADVEPYNDAYFEYEGENVHAYWYNIPETGDINAEVVKTVPPVAVPAAGTGWACDEDTGNYYYFVDGVQKFDCWVFSHQGLWYYIGMDGKLATGFRYVQNPNGTGWYMFQTDNTNGCIGRMLTGWQWTWTEAGTGWFNTAHGGLNGQCTYTTQWGAYSAATGLWADGSVHWFFNGII